MKRLLMFVGVAVVAAAMYVAASPASQRSSGPTEKQFLALKKTVTSLNKKLKTAKAEADFDTAYIGCLVSVSNGSISVLALPVSQFGTSSSGFLFGDSTTSTPRTALDVNTTSPTDVLQEFDPSCLSASGLKHGLKHGAVHAGAARLHSWIAKNG